MSTLPWNGEVQCQFGATRKGKKKGWIAMVATVEGHTLELRSSAGGKVVRSADIFGASASETAGKRKGHPHCLRVDLRSGAQDSQGDKKIVMSVASAQKVSAWIGAIEAGSKISTGRPGSRRGAVASNLIVEPTRCPGIMEGEPSPPDRLQPLEASPSSQALRRASLTYVRCPP